MSLILEALKKIERERAAPEARGFLVIGQEPWAGARSNRGWVLALIATAAAAGGAVYLLTRPAHVPATAAAPAPAAPAPGRRLQLEAISARDGVPVAVINQRVVRAGDEVEGARVVRIDATEVVVEEDGVQRRLGF